MKQWRVWIGTAALLAGATGFAVLAAEMALRLLAPRATSTSAQDAYGLAMHYPGITRRLPRFGTTATFNSAGMRDREHALEKPPGTFRILVLGDSFMEAYQVEFEQSLPSLLEQGLDGTSGRRVEVINAGVSGWGTDDQLRYLERYGMAYQPDLIVLAMTLHNDVSDNLRAYWHDIEADTLVDLDPPPIPTFEYFTLRAKAFLSVRSQLVQVYRQVRHRGESRQVGEELDAHVIELFKEPMPERIAHGFRLTDLMLEKLQRVASRTNAPVVPVLLPLVYQLSDSTFASFLETSHLTPEQVAPEGPQQRVMASAQRLGMPVVDLLPRFREWVAAGGAPLYIEWDGHWNAEGHRLAAETVVDALLESGLVR